MERKKKKEEGKEDEGENLNQSSRGNAEIINEQGVKDYSFLSKSAKQNLNESSQINQIVSAKQENEFQRNFLRPDPRVMTIKGVGLMNIED